MSEHLDLDRTYRLRFAGIEDAYHNIDAVSALPIVMDKLGYKRAFLVTSRTLNTTTDAIHRIETSLGERFAGVTDQVGSHAPLENVLTAARLARDVEADVIVAIGGGSVLDLSKVVQLCLTDETFEKEALLALQGKVLPDLSDYLYGSTKRPTVRQIAIPTTMSTAEWTAGSTPKDEATQLKARFLIKHGGPEVILYDPDIAALTPANLLFATAIRGLDHAINTRCALEPHPIAGHCAELAVKLFVENLPRLKQDQTDREAMVNCQFATSLCGLGQMTVLHGFSHWMVHIIGPYCDVRHSDAACVAMLAQAKWLQGHAEGPHNALLKILGREDQTFHGVLDELLLELGLPRHFEDLGVTPTQLDEMAPLALEHPLVTKANLRPIKTVDTVRAALELGRRTTEVPAGV